jgi:hypothetical protein
MLNWYESTCSHIKTEIRFKLLWGSAVENIWTMSVSLIQKCFTNEEGICRKVLSNNEDNDNSYR